jgi:hypothetical protein
LTDAFIKVYSLVDKTTVDTWLIGNNRLIPREDPTHVRISASNTGSSNAIIEMFDGDEILERYSRTLLFEERFGHQVDLMEVLCELTGGVSRTVDNFLKRGKDRRVFMIHSVDEYKDHVDKHMHPRDADFYMLPRSQSPVYMQPVKQPRLEEAEDDDD